MKRIFALLLVFLMLTGCTSVEATTPTTTAQPEEETTTKNIEITIEEPVAAPTEAPKSKAETILEGMSLREKVGQMFIVRPEALGGNKTGYDENTLHYIFSREILFFFTSTSRTRTLMISPTETTSIARVTRCFASLEIWTRPS